MTAAAAKDALIDDLNPPQREAVQHGEGPMLVLAGAGSGKTQVLTRRIAWLVERAQVPPRAILALTFTNKAARQMEARVADLLGERAREAWIGTFHSTALRILRIHGDKLAVGSNFAVYDGDDQIRLAKQVCEALDLDPKRFRPAALLAGVQRAKDDGRGPEDLPIPTANPYAAALYAFYRLYAKKLVEARALDFGDLLLETLRLFEEHPDVGGRYAGRFRHVLIDEYQDTNHVQYRLARAFSAAWGNLFVVGDDDQAIYGWRGADLRNILDFEAAFPDTKVVKLEQNYRSTAPILKAASAVIAHNEGRHEKTLWTDRETGSDVRFHAALTEEEEAAWIVSRIAELSREGLSPGDVAVLYRTHALSRPLEEALLAAKLPYAVYGGMRFYERREIKDLLSYLRLLVHPDDPVALRRVINVPPRGIGERTVEEILRLAAERGVGPHTAARLAVEEGLFAARAGRAVAAFLGKLEGWRRAAETLTLFQLLDRVADESGYRQWLRADPSERGVDRLENIEELLSAAEAFEREGEGRFDAFLDRAALVSDQDRQTPGWKGVTLMTIHAAKGLEFDAVFLAGLEEGVFPHALSSDSPEEIEEERRLCYVAMTRAKHRLFLSRSRTRRVYGADSMLRGPSRFLAELPPEARPRELPLPSAARPRAFDTPAPSLPIPSEEAAARERTAILEERGGEGGVYYVPDPGEASFDRGMRVRHERYGEGTVAAVEGRGPTARVTVDFPGMGRKKFVAGMAGLGIRQDA